MNQHDRAALLGSGLGTQLRQRRRELGLSQQELADLAAVSTRSVHSAEHDKATLRLDTLTDICAALGLELRVVRRGTAPLDG